MSGEYQTMYDKYKSQQKPKNGSSVESVFSGSKFHDKECDESDNGWCKIAAEQGLRIYCGSNFPYTCEPLIKKRMGRD